MDDNHQNSIVQGRLIDNQTRCVHYHSPLDVIAIKFACCRQYYACIHCHLETANHPVVVWQKTEFDTKAILCGVCKNEMTITEYKQSDNQCKYCNSAYNPNCSNHHHFYFEVE